MPRRTARAFAHVDWFALAAAISISLLGLLTMRPFEGDASSFFDRQMLWIGVGVFAFFIAAIPEYGFLRRTSVVSLLYGGAIALLAAIFLFGVVVKGAQQRFDLGIFAIQPADFAKLILIIVLAKYFARRHVAIANVRHILVSGAYAAVICGLVFLQPDFGGAIIIASIWFGMILVAGISWKHLATLLTIGVVSAGLLWQYGLAEYQQARVLTFLNPLADIQGAGYNAYQSTIAVGSGEILGKGIGLGTQSKLRFLPEYQTDFIFAAYAEEWGFIGVLFLFGLYGILIIRTLALTMQGPDNFVMLYGAGVAIMFTSHFLVHVGMNMGLLPVTGTTTPFMSYGGSHLLTEFLSLGILMGLMRGGRERVIVEDKTESVAYL
jgi:rod shape determining protein RodA